MRSVISSLFVLSLVAAAPFAVSAQDSNGQEPARPKAAQPKAPPPLPPPAPIPSRMTNIQVEITITDQLGNTPATKKTVLLIMSDNSVGRIRTNANARPSERTGVVPVVLNVDAHPVLMPGNNDQIQLDLTIEYQPLKTVQEGSAETSQTSPTALNQSLHVVMTNGKAMMVSQAADPVTDRKIVVEAKATILK